MMQGNISSAGTCQIREGCCWAAKGHLMDRKSSENCNVVCCQLLSLVNVVKSKSGSESAQLGVLIGNDLDDLLKKKLNH